LPKLSVYEKRAFVRRNTGLARGQSLGGGSYSAPPDPLAVFKGPTSKWSRGERRVGDKREGRKKEGREGKGKGKGKGSRVLPPLQSYFNHCL